MAPKIATPISTLFQSEEAASRIVAASDCLECRDFTAKTTYPNQELFHFEHELVMPWSEEDKVYLRQIFATKPDLKLASFHAAKCCTESHIVNGVFELVGQKLSREELLENVQSNVAWLRTVLPETVTIALENNNDQSTPAYEVVTDADFLKEAVESNGIAFLFDLAHAHITAHNRGVPYEEYVAGLPMSSVVQLHLCSPDLPEGESAADIHEPPSDSILEEMQTLLAQYPSISYLTVEYYKEEHGLLESIERIRSILKTH